MNLRSHVSTIRVSVARMIGLVGIYACPSLSANTVWTNVDPIIIVSESWGTPGNWNNGVPNANTAWLTNTVNSYMVNVGGTPAKIESLVMTQDAEQTVTLNLSENTELEMKDFTLGGEGVINVWSNATFRVTGKTTTPVDGDLNVRSNGNFYITMATGINQAWGARVLVEGGGYFENTTHRDIVFVETDASLTVEAGATYRHRTGNSMLGANAGAEIVCAGLIWISANLGVDIATSGSAFQSKLYVKPGGLLLHTGSIQARGIRVGVGPVSGSSSGLLVVESGGIVTNQSSFSIGNYAHASGGQRSAFGEVLIEGQWYNTATDRDVVIGGYQPTFTTANDNDAAARYTGLQGKLTQESGTFVSHGGVYVANGPSTGILDLQGGSFIVTNNAAAATLYVGTDIGGVVNAGLGRVILDGGALTVDRLAVPNGWDATHAHRKSNIDFFAGTLSARELDIDNGIAFTVGDGVQAATLNLMGGTHTVEDGLVLNPNATLTVGGTGAITNATVTGTLTLQEDARLAWTFEDGKQDALTVTGTVTLPDSAIVELTALDASTPSILPLLTATGGFSGNPANWPTVSVNGREYQAKLDGNTLQLAIPSGTLLLLR